MLRKETPSELKLELGDKIYVISFQTKPSEESTAEILAIEQITEEPQEGLGTLLRELIPEEYLEYEDVFSKDEFNILPPQKPWDHAINLTPGVELPHAYAWTFPISQAKQQELDSFLHENLASGRI